MIILIAFAFLGGIVTILSPCILPILPIVLSGSVTGGKRRPLGVVTGFIVSFTFFTLFLSTIVRMTGLSADALRMVAVFVIALFGLSLIIPPLQKQMELLFTRLSRFGPKSTANDGYLAGVLVGISLGLVWTPCVGPILASIITLAATSRVGPDAVILTLAYTTGTAIPLLAITYGGRNLLTSHPWLVKNTQAIQRSFGVLMLLTAVAIFFSWDRQFQAYILEKFPAYGTGLTSIEDNAIVRNELENMDDKQYDTDLGSAPELIPGGQWLNLPAGRETLTLSELRGQVVLIDFWTYTCINCIRTLPYLRTWHEKYADDGLIIIGVHTPEFEFEKDIGNLSKAVKDFSLDYPILQDNEFATWRAYRNRYWPAKYLIDTNGRIRYTHFGEGSYDETEQWIRKLLEEAGSVTNESIDNPDYEVLSRTPETYLGYERMAGLVSPERVEPDKPVRFTPPQDLNANQFAFIGTWTIRAEHAVPQAGSGLSYHFEAKDVFLVMRPERVGEAFRVRVLLDGAPVTGTIAGEDVTDGMVTVDSDRLYKLISLPEPGTHVLQLEFPDGNVSLFAFTFG